MTLSTNDDGKLGQIGLLGVTVFFESQLHLWEFLLDNGVILALDHGQRSEG